MRASAHGCTPVDDGRIDCAGAEPALRRQASRANQASHDTPECPDIQERTVERRGRHVRRLPVNDSGLYPGPPIRCSVRCRPEGWSGGQDRRHGGRGDWAETGPAPGDDIIVLANVAPWPCRSYRAGELGAVAVYRSVGLTVPSGTMPRGACGVDRSPRRRKATLGRRLGRAANQGSSLEDDGWWGRRVRRQPWPTSLSRTRRRRSSTRP
jgi:hypothetical protein